MALLTLSHRVRRRGFADKAAERTPAAAPIFAVYGQKPADAEFGNDVEEHGAVERVRGFGNKGGEVWVQ